MSRSELVIWIVAAVLIFSVVLISAGGSVGSVELLVLFLMLAGAVALMVRSHLRGKRLATGGTSG